MTRPATAAGASSETKYQELLRSWRRRNRKVYAIVAAICLFLLVGLLVAAELWPFLSYAWGLVGGAAVAFWLVVRLSPPGWIENWQSGAYGEQATAKALRDLERDGWVVMHDLPVHRGDVDHIAVGPGGVFLLDSKRLGGTVTVDQGGVTVRRFDDADLTYRHPGAGHLLHLARETHQRVLAASRIKLWVTPVMVIWADFPQRVAEDRCTYVHGDHLVSWLRSQPRTLAPSRVQQVADAVHAAWQAANSVTSSEPAPRRTAQG